MGLIFIAAMALSALFHREWRRGALLATAAMPGAIWILTVRRLTSLPSGSQVVPRWVEGWDHLGPFRAILNPTDYGLAGWLEPVTQLFHDLAIIAVVLAVLIAAARLRNIPKDVELLLRGLYIVLFVMVSGKGFWVDPYSYSRAFTPLAGLIAWRGVVEKRGWLAIPLCLMSVRIVWQMGPQALGVVKALLA